MEKKVKTLPKGRSVAPPILQKSPKAAPPSACISREERQWLIKHGKERFVDFREEELKQLRSYFEYLDKDKGGSISADELEEPLLALGFAENKEDVQKLIAAIDKNGNGEVELEEFLAIIKSSKQGSGGPPLGTFFKEMISGKFGKGNIPIPLFISDYRRKMIIQSLVGRQEAARESAENSEKAMKIAKAFEKKLKDQIDNSEAGPSTTLITSSSIDHLERTLNSILILSFKLRAIEYLKKKEKAQQGSWYK